MLSNRRKFSTNSLSSPINLLTSHKDNSYWFASGREAIVALISAYDLRGKEVALPAYLPEGIYAPFKLNDCTIHFYDLDDSLNPIFDQLENIFQKNTISICVFIHYFGGFRLVDVAKSLCNKYDVLLIEDLAHLIPNENSPAGKTGDFILFSLTKIVGLPDGAPIIINHGFGQRSGLAFTSHYKHKVYVVKRCLELLGGNISTSSWLPPKFKDIIARIISRLFQSYKTLMNYYAFPNEISGLSNRLYKKIDFNDLIEKRTKAYKKYYHKLDDSKYQRLELNHIHEHGYFGYPVIVSDKVELRKKLLVKGIKVFSLQNKWCFLDVEEQSKFPKAVHFLKNHLIFPTSEHLSDKDIDYIIETANSLTLYSDSQLEVVGN